MKRIFLSIISLLLCITLCSITACSNSVYSSQGHSHEDEDDGDDDNTRDEQSDDIAGIGTDTPDSNGDIICAECNNIGKYCPYCSDGECYYCDDDGRQICGHCKGTDLCYSCLGTKKMPSGSSCYTCGGNGKCPYDDCVSGMRDCFYCAGTNSCSECGGTRVCYKCGGYGKYNVNDRIPDTVTVKLTDCGKCDATGKYCIADCDGGLCAVCLGEGTKAHVSCNGSGDCSSCDGSGSMPSGRKCYGCDGSGDCADCTDGLVSCDKCRGTKLCKSCLGTFRCSECNASGKVLKTVTVNIPTPPDTEHYPDTEPYPILDDWCSNCAGFGELDCDNCFDGRCIECNGEGEIEVYATAHTTKTKDCSYCTNGKCSKCKGARILDCPYC